MTKQTRRPGMGLYFMAAILLLLAFYAFSGTGAATTVTYSQVQDLFQTEQVKSFYVKDGTELYLNLQNGTAVRNELSSVEVFREDLGDLIQEQKAQGILVDYDLAPVYTPPWERDHPVCASHRSGVPPLAVCHGQSPGGRRCGSGPEIRPGPDSLWLRQQ